VFWAIRIELRAMGIIRRMARMVQIVFIRKSTSKTVVLAR